MKAKLLLGLGITVSLIAVGVYETLKVKKEEKELLIREFKKRAEAVMEVKNRNIDRDELRKFENWLHIKSQSTGWLKNHIDVSQIIELYDMFKKK